MRRPLRVMRRVVMAVAVVSLSVLVAATPGVAQATKHVKLVSSLPMRGVSTAETQPVVNAIRMALDEAGSQVGDFAIDYQALDDGDAAGMWDTAMETTNAQNAAADLTVVAYLGPYNSGAARVSIPILCKAGLVMVSPSNTYPGLTKPGTGAADEPFRYYPTCKRNYARTIPSDDVQGMIAAGWAKTLGATKVYILYDDSPDGKAIGDAFRARASAVGLLEAGYEHVVKADTYLDLTHRIVISGADLVYFGGSSENNPGFVLRDLRAAGSTARFMGPSPMADAAFLQQAGTSAESAYATTEA
ncbi:MAG: branched-chain amino acid ABC transporter substrate-binding protein [Chloroflexi bacterium]|nr:MAG: branched-chain amino acid ABC transporter substrate-binding protein [Chloroflexota bacterium]